MVMCVCVKEGRREWLNEIRKKRDFIYKVQVSSSKRTDNRSQPPSLSSPRGRRASNLRVPDSRERSV